MAAKDQVTLRTRVAVIHTGLHSRWAVINGLLKAGLPIDRKSEFTVMASFTTASHPSDTAALPVLREQVFYGQLNHFARLLNGFVRRFIDFNLTDDNAFDLFLQRESGSYGH